jgi:hypothetical protein
MHVEGPVADEPDLPPDLELKVDLVDAVDAVRRHLTFKDGDREARVALEDAVARIVADGPLGVYALVKLGRILTDLCARARHTDGTTILDHLAVRFGENLPPDS